MNRLLHSGSFLGAALLVGCFACGTAYAGETASTTGPAAASAPMTSKPVMANHHQTAMPHKGMSLAMRKQIQIALNSHGATLAVDGMLGKKSRAAIKTFQSKNGLKATGWADKVTLEKLGIK